MINEEARNEIMTRLGEAIDDVVRELYEPGNDILMTQEPEITSRICQSVEDRLNGSVAGDYTFHVTALSMPDRGSESVEHETGADLVLSISMEGPDGFDKSVFVQSKYDHKVKKKDLVDACGRMEKFAGPEGSYVWIYGPDGVKVLSSHQVQEMRGNSIKDIQTRSAKGFVGRIMDCFAGNRKWGIPPGSDRRSVLKHNLRRLRAAHGLDIELEYNGPPY